MGRDKGMIKWRGKTLVENAIEILSALCDEIIISANNNQYNSLGVHVIQDKWKNCGPMGGILSCLNQSGSDQNLIIPVDVPFIRPEIYHRLLEEGTDYDIIVPLDHESWYQPLCSVFNLSIIEVMEEQVKHGNLGFTPLIRKVNACEVVFRLDDKDYGKQTFYNINSPADLEAIS
jgi:molybdopterin-guanine dinucleotide biosynthesis protein A